MPLSSVREPGQQQGRGLKPLTLAASVDGGIRTTLQTSEGLKPELFRQKEKGYIEGFSRNRRLLMSELDLVSFRKFWLRR